MSDDRQVSRAASDAVCPVVPGGDTGKLQALLDAAVDAIITIDELGIIESVNRAVERLFGYQPVELIGKNIKVLMPAPYRNEHDGYLANYRESGEAKIIGIGREVVGQRKDGSTFPLDLAVSEVVEGGRRSFLGIVRDVTDRTRLEAQFHQMQKMEAIGRLAGGIAHDFNTLLGSISGYSEMLLERLEGAEARRPAEQIHRCADRGAALTRQLLAFSRQEVAQAQAVNVSELIDEMRDLVDRLIGDDIALRLQLGEGKETVEADPGQLEQVVMNLVVNAVDAMPQGGELRISVDRIDVAGVCPCCRGEHLPGPFVRLRVSDSGVGIDPAIRDQLFEPFFTTKAPGKGTGLGLSTVYGIVNQAGGCLSVDSEVGAGTTFFVLLPERSGDLPAKVEEIAAREARPASYRGSETVLVVEDDEIFRELVEELLTAQGYDVRIAEDPSRALAQVDDPDMTIDLLVSDVVMPGMTGTELAARLTARMPAMRVILMSGYNDEDLASRGAEIGVASYIQKPFETAEFLRQVRALLDR